MEVLGRLQEDCPVKAIPDYCIDDYRVWLRRSVGGIALRVMTEDAETVDVVIEGNTECGPLRLHHWFQLEPEGDRLRFVPSGESEMFGPWPVGAKRGSKEDETRAIETMLERSGYLACLQELAPVLAPHFLRVAVDKWKQAVLRLENCVELFQHEASAAGYSNLASIAKKSEVVEQAVFISEQCRERVLMLFRVVGNEAPHAKLPIRFDETTQAIVLVQ